MPTFEYTAKRGPRDVVEGVVEAENRSGVLTYLAELGYVPVRITERAVEDASRQAAPPSPIRIRRVPAIHLTTFTRQFASLMRSYVPILRALRILEDQAKHPSFRHVLREVSEAVRQGQALSSGMAKFPGVFSPLYVNLIRSGEVSGALDTILDRLAQQVEQEEAMRTRVRMAFTYPTFVGVVGCGTIAFLMIFVMPRLSKLLAGLGDRLPLPTQILLAVSRVMSQWWFWAAVLGCGVALGFVARGLGSFGRLAVDRLVLRIPLLGTVVQQTEVARFARSFGLQLTHGISILQAIEVSVQVTHHRVIRSELARLSEGLRQGNTLSSCLKPLSIGTPFLVNTVAVGEEAGKVGEAMTEIAAYYERDSERILEAMATLLEPTLILVIGVVVGFIVFAVLLPIFEMSTLTL